MSTYKVVTENELYHHGIIGQKWGVRRYQNHDGTLTEAGRRRIRKTYDKEVSRTAKKANVYKTFSEEEKKAAETLRKEGREANEVRDTYAKVKNNPILEKVYIDKGKEIEDHYDMDAIANTIIYGKDYTTERFIKNAILDESLKSMMKTTSIIKKLVKSMLKPIKNY